MMYFLNCFELFFKVGRGGGSCQERDFGKEWFERRLEGLYDILENFLCF